MAKYNSGGNLLWVRQAGGNGDDAAIAVAVDADGAAFVTGFFSGTATLDGTSLVSGGFRDAFIAKFAFTNLPGLCAAKSGTSLVLTWPVYPMGFVLECGDGLPATNWSSVGAAPTITSQTNVVTLSLTAQRKFYRLKR